MEFRKMETSNNYRVEWTINHREQTPVIGNLDVLINYMIDRGADDIESLTVGDVVETKKNDLVSR